MRRFTALLLLFALGAVIRMLLRAETESGDRGQSDGREARPRRCAATTRDGRRCSREAEAGSAFCWQHA